MAGMCEQERAGIQCYAVLCCAGHVRRQVIPHLQAVQ